VTHLKGTFLDVIQALGEALWRKQWIIKGDFNLITYFSKKMRGIRKFEEDN
jgi:hypothetical protein